MMSCEKSGKCDPLTNRDGTKVSALKSEVGRLKQAQEEAKAQRSAVGRNEVVDRRSDVSGVALSLV